MISSLSMEFGEVDAFDESEHSDALELRSPEEVTRRCVVLYGLIGSGHKKVERPPLVAWLKSEGIWPSVSPKEAAFLTAKAPEPQQFLDATWRAEALQPLLWSLGKLRHMNPPTHICDMPRVQDVLPRLFTPVSKFIDSAELRSDFELAEAAEEIYQIHWTIRDAQIHNREIPDGLNPDIVRERHYALNWLTHLGDEWDDVTTDT